jgi:hypothetical protein
MFPSDLENAYAYETERRKDEMRDAANNNLVRRALGKRGRVAVPVAALSVLALIWIVLISH